MKKKNANSISPQQLLLLNDIKNTRKYLDTIYRNFQQVSDPDLIDCYIYEMNSANLRYKYLIKQLREVAQTIN